MEDVLTKVCRVLSEMNGREIQPDNPVSDAGFDSLDLVEAVLNLEEEFPNVSFDSYEPTLATTPREIVAFIEAHGA